MVGGFVGTADQGDPAFDAIASFKGIRKSYIGNKIRTK
jgi:hypothetical protein